MRVWALASCSGLLALAACSAEQPNSPDLGTAPPNIDDGAQLDAQPGLRATASSPMARPELQPRQRGGDQARFSPRSPQSTPQASRTSNAGQTLPQAAQLRERLQRLRSQHGSRLSPSTPIATASLPAALTTTPPRPVPQAAADQSPEPLPGEARVGNRPSLEPSLRPAVVTALPTPPRPNVAAPELGLPLTASTGIDLGPVASSQTTSYPTASARHQGYSTRSQQPAPVIAAASTELSAGPTARLHGATPVWPSGATVATAQPSPPATTVRPEVVFPAPAQAETAAPESAPLATDVEEVRLAPAAAEPNPATTHQSSATIAIAPQPLEALALAPTPRTHQSQGTGARPETTVAAWDQSPTVAPPESLPFNQETPRLRPSRPAAASSAAPDLTATNAPQGAASQQQQVAQALEPELADQIPAAPVSVAQNPAAQAPGSSFSAHQGQTQLESLSLIPQPEASPKDLPATTCLQTSGRPLTSSAESGSDPQFSNQQPTVATAIRLSPSEAALASGRRLSKSELATCLEESRPIAEPAAADGDRPALTSD
ncbi:MAG: hypothetical protein WA939_01695 [Nodosilinea sp.]